MQLRYGVMDQPNFHKSCFFLEITSRKGFPDFKKRSTAKSTFNICSLTLKNDSLPLGDKDMSDDQISSKISYYWHMQIPSYPESEWFVACVHSYILE